MHMQDEEFELWELEWQDYAADPDTLDNIHGFSFHVKSWLIGLGAAASLVLVWVGIIYTIVSVVHWIQRLIP